MKRLILALLAIVAIPAQAGDFDTGLLLDVGVDKKAGKHWTLGAEAEMRTRNDFRTFDRWSLSADATYKAAKWLKLCAGYSLLINNYEEKINLHDDGELNNWRPSYWQATHRVFASAQVSVNAGRFGMSLRERWQYTYRPESEQSRYDFDDKQWQTHVIEAKGKHVLRSRLTIDYNIPRCKVDPYYSIELFNDMKLSKTRHTLGGEWKPQKAHSVDFFLRLQDIRKHDALDSSDPDRLLLGIAYKYKF